MSSALELGEVAYTSPVEGLMMSNTSPDADGRSSPLMMLEKTCLSAMALPFSPYCLENPIIAPHVRVAVATVLDIVLGASRAGFWSKNPNGLSQNEMMSTGMIGQSSIRVMWWIPKTYHSTTSVSTRDASSVIQRVMPVSSTRLGRVVTGRPPFGVVVRGHPHRMADDRSSLRRRARKSPAAKGSPLRAPACTPCCCRGGSACWG